MALIQETHIISASNTDILAAPSRLSSIPRGGILTLEWSANASNATNYFSITCQTPEGDVPYEDVQVPYNAYNTSNDIMHTDSRLRYQFTASQGGHFLLSAVETGAARLYLMASLVF
jgi:hypothetical protein